MRNKKLLVILVPVALIVLCCVGIFLFALVDVSVREIGLLPTYTPTPTIAPPDTPSPTPFPTDTPLPTDTPTPTETPLPTETPGPTDTPLPPTDTPEPTHTPVDTPIPTDTPVTSNSTSSFVSGGLGLSQVDWEKVHTKTDLDYIAMGTGYDRIYDVVFQESNVWYIERQWSTDNPVTPDVIKVESQGLIPADSQLVETYSPEGRPETIVNLYMSESLKSRFNSENSVTGNWWTGGESGNFTVQYNQYDYGVTRMIIALGNNP